MAFKVVFKAIPNTKDPFDWDGRKFNAALRKGLLKESKIHRGIIRRTVSNWESTTFFELEKPRNVGGDTISTVKTESTPFVWVEQGTESRPAAMVEGWTPKSKVKKLRSYPGKRGRVLAVNKGRKAEGVKPRQFFPTMGEIRQPKFESDMATKVFPAAIEAAFTRNKA